MKIRMAAIPKMVPSVAPSTVNIFDLLSGAAATAAVEPVAEALGDAVSEAVAVGRLLDIEDVPDADNTCCPPKKVVAFTHAFSFALNRHKGSCAFPPRATVIPSSPWERENPERVYGGAAVAL